MSWVGQRALPVSLCVLNLAVLACTSAPAQAPEATRTPTPASPEEQASNPDPGPSPSPEEESANADPEPTPTSPPSSQLSPGTATTTPAATTTAPAATTAPAVTTTVEAATTTAPAATTTTQAATTTTPAATTTASVDDDSPVGDCFGGVLSEDPLHCYVLEQAQAEGLINILAMYDSNGPLYVSISQTESSEELVRYSVAKSHAFTEAWPELVPLKKYGQFLDMACSTFPGCYLPRVGLALHEPHRMLPPSSAYVQVLLLPGGDAGRREVPGWAGWRQLWPAGASGASGSGSGSATFDVSDVDMTNLPDGSSSTGFAGRHDGGGITYVQVKNPPTDEAGLHILRKAVNPCYDIAGRCEYTHTNGKTRIRYTRRVHRIEFISVKYQIAELRRWAEILDRFALSAGNTLGITGARVYWNVRWGDAVYLNGLTASGDPAMLRETIEVSTRDVHGTVDALPVLLPLLGIPVDAVGVVGPSFW